MTCARDLIKDCPNFSWQEFLKPPIVRDDLSLQEQNNVTRMAKALQHLRNGLFKNRAITIESGYRTDAQNRAAGGSLGSYHRLGLAADINVAGLTPAKVQEMLADWHGGLGRYDAHTHIDLGPMRRWSGKSR